MSEHVLARSSEIDLQRGFLSIDGVRLPWWLANVEPEIRADIESGIVELTITFLVEGVVVLTNPTAGRQYIDSRLGDVSEWARTYVRDQLSAAYPDLKLP